MKFIKENSYDIVKFFIYQAGIAIFSIALLTAVSSAIEDDDGLRSIMKLVVSILAVGFYIMLVYTVSWEYGAKDRIRIDAGKISGDSFKAAKIALLANLPNFVFSGVAIISSLLYADGNVWTTILGIFLAIIGLIESMYIGVIQFILCAVIPDTSAYYFLQSLCFFLLPILIVASAHLGFTLGDKNVKIFGFAGKKTHKK